MDLVINLLNREEVLIEKLVSRRICPSCDKNFNTANIHTEDGYIMKPLLPKGSDLMMDGLECDSCKGVKLVQRDDDKEHIIKGRLMVYDKQTRPILDFMKQRTQVIEYETKRGVEDYPKIKQLAEILLHIV